MLAHNRPGKGKEANRAYTQCDSPGGSTGAKSDIYDCLDTAAALRMVGRTLSKERDWYGRVQRCK